MFPSGTLARLALVAAPRDEPTEERYDAAWAGPWGCSTACSRSQGATRDARVEHISKGGCGTAADSAASASASARADSGKRQTTSVREPSSASSATPSGTSAGAEGPGVAAFVCTCACRRCSIACAVGRLELSASRSLQHAPEALQHVGAEGSDVGFQPWQFPGIEPQDVHHLHSNA